MKKLTSKMKTVLAKTDGRCFYCGDDLGDLFWHLDHCHPRCKGGDDSIDNLVAACRGCNVSKGGLDIEEYRSALVGRVRNHLQKAYTYTEKIIELDCSFAAEEAQALIDNAFEKISEANVIFYGDSCG